MNVNYNSLSTGRDTLLKNGIGDSVGSPPISNSKAMRKSWLVMLVLLLSMTFGQLAQAQTINATTYPFAASSGASLQDMSTGTTTLVGSASDDGASAVQNIGFEFMFMGNKFTQFSANANGLIRLGGTVVSGAFTNTLGSGDLPALAPYFDDLATGTNGRVNFKVVGTAPNRILVVDWLVTVPRATGGVPAASFQAWLYETGGVIEYRYGAGMVADATNSGASIGFANTSLILASVTLNATSTSSTCAYGTANNVNTIGITAGTKFTWTPPVVIPADPTSLTFTAVAFTTTTVNWLDNSTNETNFIVTRALDAGFTTGVVNTFVATTTSGTTGTAYTLAQTGLSAGTTYFYRVSAATEGYPSAGLTGSQATTAGATYFWVGASASPWTTAGNWNTIAVGGGSTRSTPLTTDILIVDGAGIVAGGALIIPVGASATIGQLRVTSGTALTLQSDTTTQRVLTISGGGGDDFAITAGSTLSLSNLSNPISIVFTGGGNTGLIDGTLNVSGSSTTASAANSFLTTGGTGTVVTVSSTGIINNNATLNISTNGNVTGSVATLVFANGSAYNATGATTLAFWLPLATWGTTSTVTVSGITTSTTGPTNNNQSFGNFVYNCPAATATMSVFTSTTTAVIKGDLTITAGAIAGTGIFRALTTGTLNVTGNVNVLQGRFQSASSTGTLIVSGNTTISANGIVDILAGTYSQRGTTFTNNGTLTGVVSTATLQFLNFSNIAQTYTGTGTVLTNVGVVSLQNSGGLTLSGATNQLTTLRVNLFLGTVTGSAKFTLGTGAALTTTTQIGAAGLLTPGGSYDAIPTFNLGTGAYNVIYAQESVARTTGFEIPSSRLISALTMSNSNGLVVSGGGLGTGTLTFSALSGGNITTTAANLLTVTGTATTNVVRTLATAYVNGPLALTLPASLAATTYTFPIGKGSLNTFALVGATTNAGGTVTIMAEAFDGDAGGTAGINISTMSTTRYWAASITAGGANFTSSLIQLNDVSTGRDAIAASATQTGAYDIQGGVAITTTATSLTTTAPANTTLPGFFLMANKAAANITNVVVAPVGNQCTNVARTITADVTPGGGTVTTVVINYTVNGVAGPGSPISMTATTANGFPLLDSYTGTIPTVTPANAAVVWSITATDSNLLTKTVSGTSYQDEPLLAFASASASTLALCAGASTTLTAVLNGAAAATIGTQTTTEFSGSIYRSGGATGDFRHQLIYTAAELTAAGVTAGNLTSLGFTTTGAGSGYVNYTISLGSASSTTAVAAFQGVALTQVFTQASVSPTLGLNTYTFQTPYVWNGTSDILVNICYNVPVFGTSATVAATTPAAARNSSFLGGVGTCTAASGTTFANRPLARFGYNAAPAITSVSWSDGVGEVSTSNPFVAFPSVNTTYTATITAAGCTISPAGLNVVVNPVPTAPTQTVFTNTCGTGVPLVAVSDPNGFTTPSFKWYAADGTTLLQTNVATTFLGSISATTTFKVSVVNPTTGCESLQTTVTANVDTPTAIDAIANQAVCIGSSFALTATSANLSYNYTWTATPVSGSGIATSLTGATQTILPTAVGTYTYTVAGTDGVCSTTTTFTATVSAYPTLSGATATPAAICANGISTLTASIPTAVTQYPFTGSTGTYTAIVGTNMGASSIGDDVGVGNLPIGFSFSYNGVAETVFAASSNGFIQLGNTSATISGFSGNSMSTNAKIISAFWDDNNTTGGSIQYLTTGIAPNRVLTVQWTGMHVAGGGSSTNPTLDMQIQLFENGDFQYNYGPVSAALSSPAASVGYSAGVGTFRSMTPLSPASSSTSSTATENTAATAVNLPSGTIYTFTKPVPGNITWAPTTDLYTDALATIPYTGTAAATVYAKPTTPGSVSIYNATLSANGCNTVSANVSVTQNADVVAAITGGATSICLGSPTIPDPIPAFSSSVGVEWISSVPAVATIDIATGALTPLTAGITVISARIVNLTTGCTTFAPNTVSVNVYAPIAITASPTATSVLEYDGITPTSATFTVAASGSVSSYQWQVSPTGGVGTFVDVSGAFYSGATGPVLTITNATIALNGQFYQCVVAGNSPCASPVISGNALFTVSDIAIVTHPTFTTPLCGSGNATFSVVAVCSSPIDYSWYYSDDAGATFNLIDGTAIGGVTITPGTELTASLTMNGLTTANHNWQVIAVVTSSASSNAIESNPAIIIVNTAQTVGPTPVADSTICFNSVNSSNFTVTSSGGSGFQWQYSATNNGIDWVNVATATPVGATYLTPTGATLTVNTTAVLAVGTYYYRCMVAGPSGCPAIPSNVATLTVTTPTITAIASIPTFCGVGGTSVLTASGAGVGGSYAWTAAASLAAPLNLDTVTATPTITTTYTVTGTTAAGCISTGTVQVVVAPDLALTATASATPDIVCLGTDSQLLASANIPGGVVPAASTYCASTHSSACLGDNVSRVVLNTLDKTTGITCGTTSSAYSDFTGLTGTDTTTLTAGSPYTLSLTFGTDSSQFFGAWIDYNHNGTYETTEFLGASGNAGASGTIGVTFTPPASALNGLTHIRIVGGNDSAVTSSQACGASSSSFGETQDYDLTLTGGTAIATYTYSWSPATFLSATNIANPVATAVTATTAYTVTITSSTGCSTTKNVTVTLASAIDIVGQPQPASFCQGTTASLSVGATGAGLTYQWRKGGVDIFGEISSSITFPAADLTVSGSYDVVIGDACGGAPVTSDAAVLTIIATPTVNAVSAQSSCAGTTLPVALSGSTTTFNISGGAAIGLANASGVTEVPSFTGIAGSATISVTPTVTSGATTCTGTATTFLYTINPTPGTPTAGSNSPSCDGIGNINLTASTVSIPGYSMNASSGVAFIDIAATGTSVTVLGDDTEHNITIPSFTFNGIAYTAARLGMNGAIVLGATTGEVSLTNTAMPNTANSAGNVYLAPYWDDLDIQTGATVHTQTVGTKHIIQYTNAAHDAFTTGSITFQVQLDLVTGQVTYVYQDVIFGSAPHDSGVNATVGIQMSSTSAVQYSHNTASLVNGQSITFTPNVASYAWTGPNGFTSSLQNPTTPSIALAAGVYSVTATNVATGCTSPASTTTVVVNTPTLWYADADLDGFGNLAITQLACAQPVGYVANSTDCDDTNIAIYQLATFFVDADLDTYGSTATASVCSGLATPVGYSLTNDDCDDTNALLNPTNPCPTNSIVNLTLFMGGYYNGASTMRSVKLLQWDGVTPVIAPSALDVEDLTIELHDSTTPFATLHTTTATLHTDGTLSASFAGAPSGSFYIAVKGVNSVETWSASPQTVGAVALNYDFSTAVTQVYEDNMFEVETGVFAFYQGDINQDGGVDNQDADALLLDIDNSAFGVQTTDLNGDGGVDNQDADILYPGIDLSIYAHYPI